MTPLRLAFDLDGVVADFESAYRRIEEDLFGAVDPGTPVAGPEAEVAAGEATAPADGDEIPADAETPVVSEPANVRRDRVWREISATPNFWTTLAPLDPSVLPRLQRLAVEYRWETFFVTHRPATLGDTVQRQSQLWLQRHGFELPSVLSLTRSRATLAAALHLHYLVDDTIQNCVDVGAESDTKVMLVLPHDRDGSRARNARRLGMLVVSSASEALDLLEDIQERRVNPSLLTKMARAVGWKSELRIPPSNVQAG